MSAVELLSPSRTYRVYFNRAGAAPLMWCVSPVNNFGAAWELCVQSVLIHVPSSTQYVPKATADEDDGLPSAWVEATGSLYVDERGHAVIR